MLPEAQRYRANRCTATCGSSLKIPRVTVPETHEVERLYQPCLDEFTGEPQYNDIYHAMHAVRGATTSERMTPISHNEGLSGAFITDSGGPDERVSFYTVPHTSCHMSLAAEGDFHPIYEARPNTQQAALNPGKNDKKYLYQKVIKNSRCYILYS